MRSDFKKPTKDEVSYYDLTFDAELIEQSIAKQYHILPSEQGDLSYSDWCKMVSGLMDDTPLGRVVQIRCETDRKIIAKFTPSQRRIRSEWERFKADKQRQQPMSEEQLKQTFAGLEQTLKKMFGEELKQ